MCALPYQFILKGCRVCDLKSQLLAGGLYVICDVVSVNDDHITAMSDLIDMPNFECVWFHFSPPLDCVHCSNVNLVL